jgi:hypothetical protein
MGRKSARGWIESRDSLEPTGKKEKAVKNKISTAFVVVAFKSYLDVIIMIKNTAAKITFMIETERKTSTRVLGRP